MPDPKNVLSIVPEVYYDLIARVVPGTVFVVGTLLVCEPSRTFLLQPTAATTGLGFATAALVVLLGTGYTVALLATPFGDRLRHFYARFVWEQALQGFSGINEVLSKQFGYSAAANPESLDLCYRRIHVHLRRSDSSSRTLVLSKMQAEASLATNLSSLFLMLLLIKIVFAALGSWSFLSYLEWHKFELASVVAAASVSTYAAVDRNVRLLQRHFAFVDQLQKA